MNNYRRVWLVVLALLCVAAKHPSASWTLRYSSGVTLRQSPISFTFPRPPGSVNYLTRDYTTPIAQTQALLMTVQIIGSPTFNYMLEPWNVCVVPASVRPYVESQVPKKCPDATYTCAPPSARQWADTAVELAEGTFSIAVPFTPDRWSDAEGVSGSADLDGFSWTLSHPRYLGMTFGGGCFYGHGVNVDGPASFVVKDFRVQ